MGTVGIGIAASYGICRVLGLPARMAILVACGNAICGNSAIAAVAPVIDAEPKDIAASIAFTAVLGVLMVLGLPLFVPLAGLSDNQYGVLAGLTVYAVPQVLAATVPVSLLATQVGTLVKLVRVLMLGPVVVAFSLIAPRLPDERGRPAPRGSRLGFTKLVPWFILGFLALATGRSLGLVPDAAVRPADAARRISHRAVHGRPRARRGRARPREGRRQGDAGGDGIARRPDCDQSVIDQAARDRVKGLYTRAFLPLRVSSPLVIGRRMRLPLQVPAKSSLRIFSSRDRSLG